MPLALRADDTDAQAKAREALEQKLKDMQSQPANVKAPAKPIAPAAPATPAPKPKKDAVKPVPAQVVTAPAPTTAAPTTTTPVAAPVAPQPSQPAEVAQPAAATATPMPASGDSEAVAKAREALRQKMQELDAQPAGTPVRVVSTPRPVAPPSTPAPVAPPTAPVVTSSSQPAPSSDPNMTATRPPGGQRPVPTPHHTPKPGQRAALSFPPLQGPPNPLPAAKQQQLDELLRQYKADQISAEKYHDERAKIVGEP